MRLALCAVTIVPVRMLLIAILVPLYYMTARTWLALTPDRPWSHSVSIYVLRKASWLLLLIMGYWKVGVFGRENMGRREEPRVFISNHISYVEILFFLAELGPSFVMKRTCARVPFVGSIATRVLDSVSVDNKGGKQGGSGSQAIATRLELMFGKQNLADWQGNVAKCPETSENRNAESGGTVPLSDARAEGWARGWQGNPLLLFPEGTTSNGSCLLRFRTGVFAGGMPVHPVTVKYEYNRFSPAFESILAPVHTFRMLAEPVNHLRVKFLPPYCPTPEQRTDREAYAKALQGIFCKATGLPPADSGYAEKTKYHKYLRQRFLEHPWGKAAFVLPAPDRHEGLTSVEWGNDDVFSTDSKRVANDDAGSGGATSEQNGDVQHDDGVEANGGSEGHTRSAVVTGEKGAFRRRKPDNRQWGEFCRDS